MLIKYDKEIDAKYILLSSGGDTSDAVVRTEQIQPWLLVDYDKNGNVFGVEILNASKHEGSLVIAATNVYHIPSSTRTQSSALSEERGEDRVSISLGTKGQFALV